MAFAKRQENHAKLNKNTGINNVLPHLSLFYFLSIDVFEACLLCRLIGEKKFDFNISTHTIIICVILST